MKKKMMQLWKDEEGATMVEYGVMVALIAAVLYRRLLAAGRESPYCFYHVNTAMP